MFLPDTNIFIRALHGVNPEADFLKRAILTKKLAISVIVVAEFFSKANEVEAKLFEKLLDKFGSLSVDEFSAKAAAEYRKEFLRKTKRVFLLDCFLASQAKLNNLTLVTNNIADFPMPDIRTFDLSASLKEAPEE